MNEILYKKGDTITSATPWMVIPLFCEDGTNTGGIVVLDEQQEEEEEQGGRVAVVPHRRRKLGVQQLPRYFDYEYELDPYSWRQMHLLQSLPSPAVSVARIRRLISQEDRLNLYTTIQRAIKNQQYPLELVIALVVLFSDADHHHQYQIIREASTSAGGKSTPTSRREPSAAAEEDHLDEEEFISSEDYYMLQQVWLNTVVVILQEEAITFRLWVELYHYVTRNCYIVLVDHPLTQYSAKCIPNLSLTEREKVCQILRLPDYYCHSTLSMMKYIQDTYKPQQYAILFEPHQAGATTTNMCSTIQNYRHSCIPTAQLELQQNISTTRNAQPVLIRVVALYDITEGNKDDDNVVTLCFIQDHESVETRDRFISRRIGQSCNCLRCYYETNPSNSLLAANIDTTIHLGHFYLSQGRYKEAQYMYDWLVLNHPNLPDPWHALGAIHLSQGRFLKAQRIWNTATQRYPRFLQEHGGLALQVVKLESYGILRGATLTDKPSVMPTWKCLWPSLAFLTTRLVDKVTCQQIIAWAEESSEWANTRHYAVPTVDVPLHKDPNLLNWFKHLVEDSIRHVLADQFRTSSNYYVHDAFCVRYEATGSSNHLPIHMDESTHSLILALNDNYDGGGTHFYKEQKTIHLKSGELISFRGDRLLHGGEAVTRGRRYIIAAFLYHDDDNCNDDNTTDRVGSKHFSDSLFNETINESKKQKFEFSFGSFTW